MKLLNLLMLFMASAVCCFSCDDGELKLDQETASLYFESNRVEIEQATEGQIPLVVYASKGSTFTYQTYIAVEDPEGWIGDVCTIANPVYKAPDHENGDHLTIYTAKMGEGMLKTALLLTAGVHGGEDIDRELEFKILNDPLKASYPCGNLYYQVNGTPSMTVLLKKMEP